MLDAYRFLIDTYESGDWLYLFGFSRGAFTARSLAGLIRNSGILRRENAGRIDQAWAMYRSSADTPRGVAATLFRRVLMRTAHPVHRRMGHGRRPWHPG